MEDTGFHSGQAASVPSVLERMARAMALSEGEDYMECHKQYDALARAALLAMREPIDEWLDHQIDHGFAPGGQPVEMAVLYGVGRKAAFQSTKAMIDAILAESPQ